MQGLALNVIPADAANAEAEPSYVMLAYVVAMEPTWNGTLVKTLRGDYVIIDKTPTEVLREVNDMVKVVRAE